MSEPIIKHDAPVLFEQINCKGEKYIGVVTLNVQKTLNALTLEMIEMMLDQLHRWQHDSKLVCVFIKGAGEKALCAGGDVQALYRSATEQPGGPCDYAETFFAKEYQLDYLLHQFLKPVICWGSAIVMGGGLGIFAACSHRIVTETTRMAMPEVTIALYPDVGGSWFLNKMPGHIGLFLAITGVPFNSADSLLVGIADYFITSAKQRELLEHLCSQSWSDDSDENRSALDNILATFSASCKKALPPSDIESNQQIINELCQSGDIYTIVDAISTLNADNSWLQRAQKTLMSGSPLSVLIIYQQLQRCKTLSLAEVFRSELVLSTNIVRYREFAEGVRALLIDKDKKPQWQYSCVQDVPAQLVEQFFVTPVSPAPWPDNPLDNI